MLRWYSCARGCCRCCGCCLPVLSFAGGRRCRARLVLELWLEMRCQCLLLSSLCDDVLHRCLTLLLPYPPRRGARSCL